MNKIDELVKYLKECDDAYYNSEKPIASNDTYDSLVESLKRMDPANPYLNKVGAEPNGTNKVGRIIPMGTLAKYHEDEEIKEWLSKEASEIIIAPKYDGFGVELTYVNGNLVLASTRGNGNTGEDVTESIMKIKNIPHQVPSNLTTVRGEVIIPRENHGKMKELGYAAMRNAIPGIVRSGRTEALPYVNFVAYEFFDGAINRVSQRYRYSSIFDVEEFEMYNYDEFNRILYKRNKIGDNKESYKYEIDGVVLKTVKIKEDDLSCPTHQIAWKYKSNRRETILREVVFQMGVTGKFTPIGVFDPVEFQGAQLSRASLGSMDRYNELRPCIGDTIEVSRRGDIIPFIEDVVETSPDNKFISLDVCPNCNEPLVNYACNNISCPEKLNLQIRNFVGTIGVKGIGPSLVLGLINSGAINRLSDIYKVTRENIIGVPRQGDSSASKWDELINKEISLNLFMSALPFDNIGGKTWDSIIDKWSFDEIMVLTVNDLSNAGIRGLGESKINDIIRQKELYKDDIISMYGMAKIR